MVCEVCLRRRGGTAAMGGVEDLKAVLRMTRMDLWGLIETALSVAARDYREELKVRRDRYVELLYVNPVNGAVNGAAAAFIDEDRCDNGVGDEDERDEREGERVHEHVVVNDDEGVVDDEDEETKVLAIKELIEDLDQVCSSSPPRNLSSSWI